MRRMSMMKTCSVLTVKRKHQCSHVKTPKRIATSFAQIVTGKKILAKSTNAEFILHIILKSMKHSESKQLKLLGLPTYLFQKSGMQPYLQRRKNRKIKIRMIKKLMKRLNPKANEEYLHSFDQHRATSNTEFENKHLFLSASAKYTPDPTYTDQLVA